MGRIKSTMVKRAAEQLMDQNTDKFSDSYEYNKRILGSNTMPSKKIRNKVAGYIARLVQMEKKEAAKLAAK
jgi:small subunit ribosomal protein S17e